MKSMRFAALLAVVSVATVDLSPLTGHDGDTFDVQFRPAEFTPVWKLERAALVGDVAQAMLLDGPDREDRAHLAWERLAEHYRKLYIAWGLTGEDDQPMALDADGLRRVWYVDGMVLRAVEAASSPNAESSADSEATF